MDNRLVLLDLARKWSAPAELIHSRPRSVGLTATGRVVLGLACALFIGGLAAGIGLWRIAFREAADARQLELEGVVTEGIVTRVWRGRGDSRQTWIAYRFMTPNAAHDTAIRLPLRIWNNLRPGSAVPIRYVTSNPDLNCPIYVTRQRMPLWLPFAIGFAMAAGGVLIAVAVRVQGRLLAEGRTAPAMVTRLGDVVRSTHGGNHGRKYYYEFAVLSGAIAKGQSGPTRRFPAMGSTLCVLYDPENPAKNAPYPFSLVRVSR